MPEPTIRRLHLPAPPTYTGTEQCPDCHGRKITGERYAMPGGEHTVLLVDELCPACGGCGHDRRHDGCTPADHAGWDPTDAPGHDPHGEDAAGVCPSCHGRTWWTCEGFDSTGADQQVRLLRMPCGCATPLLEEVPS